MNAKLATLSTVAFALAFASRAQAQNEKKTWFEQPLEAPTRALEIVVGTGYTQGFGSLQSGVDMRDVITPGIGVDVGLGYRANPHWALMFGGQYQEFAAERAASARGFLTGVAAAYHVAPYTRTDPWVQLGAGYRFLWENPHDVTQPNLLSHGIELAKLTVGVDFRVDKDVAIAPVIGADVTLPLWQAIGGNASVAINDPRPSTFVFAGLQARFDVTAEHESAKRPEPVAPAEITRAEIPQPAEKVQQVSPSIAISEDLLAACKLNLDDVAKAPKFEFDKTDLLPGDVAVLQQIAACFTTGPLKDAQMILTGRADPRGTIRYNDALGIRRASTVGDYLESLGVSYERIGLTSRGERDATGTDEPSWAVDRRVDITLRH